MNVLIYLVPMALALGLTGLIAFLWSLRAGQYDDLDGAALRVLSDEDVSGARPEYGARRMTRRIAIIQGHPDPAGHHLLHAMADAYAEGATAAGHEVRRIEVALLDFPLLRTQVDFESGALPPALSQPREDMRWAEHWVFLFPLWHGTLPALFKGFLEHIFQPGFAVEYKKDRFPQPLLAGRSARIVVTMGMPALIYRWYFGAAGLRSFERSMLGFSGIKPVRESLYGLTFAGDRKRARWIEDMRRHGVRGD